jgi:nickel-dependent lactate racemase
MQITLPYGKASITASIPDSLSVEHVRPHTEPPADDPFQVVRSALANPVGGISLDDFYGMTTVAIAINDKTRPVPHDLLLPPLLNELERRGFLPENITLVIATGTHPVMPAEEYPWILPREIINRYPIICHDSTEDDSLLYLGTTSYNTPVYINRHFMNAQLRIVIGNIEPHQFMGFSGGVKSASIGLAGKKTINHNHSLMMHQNARLGTYDENPARQDVEEIGRMIGIHFAHNALLNINKKIVDVASGDPVAVMAATIPRVRKMYETPIAEPFDVLIVSPGGHPKDINVYQSQKAIAHARLGMKEGGTIILCAACPEGTGSDTYESWITDGSKQTHDDVFQHFESGGFQVGPHKAFQISRDAARVKVILVSEMEPDFVRKLLLHPESDLQSAVDNVLSQVTVDSRIGVMPSANTTIPLASF